MPKQNDSGVIERVSNALHKEDWNMIVKMARDPISAKPVTTANVGFGGGTALHMAAYCHKLDVSMVLIDAGADLAAKDKEGYTPLHIASLSGAQAVAELLLARGADVGATNAYGWTPLHAASVNGHIQVALFLISRGAHAEAPAKDGRTPAAIAAASGRGQMAKILKQAAEVSVLPQKRRAVESPQKPESPAVAVGMAAISRRKKFEQDMEDDESDVADDEEHVGDDDGNDMDVSDGDAGAIRLANKRNVVKGAKQQGKFDGNSLPQTRWARKLATTSLPNLSTAADGQEKRNDGNVPAVLDSPVAVRNGQNSFGDPTRQANKQFAGNPRPSLRVQARPEFGMGGLPVLPPAPSSAKNAHGARKDPSTLLFDIGSLSVSQVASLMTQYVCEGHDEETTKLFAVKIRKGVLAYRLSGRALVGQEPQPSDLARAILLGHQSVRTPEATKDLEQDVLYFLVVDFIRLARMRTTSTFAFNLSSLSRSMRESESKSVPDDNKCMGTESPPGSAATKSTAGGKVHQDSKNNVPSSGEQMSAAALAVRSAKKLGMTRP